MYESIYPFRCLVYLFVYFFFNFTQITVNFNTNNVDSDQLPRSAGSDQRFHCLPMFFITIIISGCWVLISETVQTAGNNVTDSLTYT